MFLSNRLASVSFLIFLCAAAPCCSWIGGSDNTASASTVIEPPASEIPFETREPDTFQADYVTTAAGIEALVHYTRKGANWRVDTFTGERPDRTIIHTDKQIQIDHRSRTYAEAPSGGGRIQRPPHVADMTESLLNQKEHAKFEPLDNGGQMVRYRVTVDGSTTPFIITYDRSAKMVTRHEPENPAPGGFVFEVRGLTLNVDDDAFTVPDRYRRVTWQEFLKIR